MPPKKGTLKKPTPSSAPLTKRMFGRGNVCRSSASQPSAGGVAAAEHSGAASERSQEEVKVIGAAPARTKSSHEEAPATEQRRDRRAEPKPPAVAPPAKLQRRGGWFQKCQELSDAVLNGDHDRAMELAYCYRGKKHELEKLEKAQDQGYYSKK